MSIAYYDQNAEAFFRDTVAADVSSLRSRFLAHVPPGSAVLDAGCGSGRDAAAFQAAGYRVTAFDGSAEMVRLAREHTGLPVQQMTFDEMTWEATFDGIWASASLLHVPLQDLPGVVAHMARALRPEGALYISMKHGNGERHVNGRTFTDITPEELARLIKAAGLEIAEVWETVDVRPGREDRWVNALVRHASSTRAS